MFDPTQLPDMTIEEVLTQWPQTAELLRHYKMTDCIGCRVAPFCTIAEALRIYNLPEEPFLTELQQLIESEIS